MKIYYMYTYILFINIYIYIYIYIYKYRPYISLDPSKILDSKEKQLAMACYNYTLPGILPFRG